jgi:tetratricopeptide (TPR) repeat protein
VSHAEPQITNAEFEQSRRKQPENLDAYDHFLLGTVHLNHMGASATLYNRMVGHLDRAVALDPSFPLALLAAAKGHEWRVIFGGCSPPGTDDQAIAEDLGKRSLALAPTDALVLIGAAMRTHNYKDDGEGALALAERAIALNPHSDTVLATAACILRQRGRTGEAIQLYERCLTLSPNSPWNAMQVENIGCCHLYDGRYAEAADCIRRALAMGASWDLALVNLIVAEALLGDMDAARSTLERFLRIRPGATIQGVLERLPPGSRGGEGRIWTEGLRRVGLPED